MKSSQPELEKVQSEIIECAFLIMETLEDWTAMVTWKCPVCGRRNRVQSSGPGKLYENLPVAVICKLGHESKVKPYRS